MLSILSQYIDRDSVPSVILHVSLSPPYKCHSSPSFVSFKLCHNNVSTQSYESVAQPLNDKIYFSPLNNHGFHIQNVKLSLSPLLLQISNRIIQSAPVAMKTKQKAEGERGKRRQRERMYFLYLILSFYTELVYEDVSWALKKCFKEIKYWTEEWIQ